MQTQKIIIIAFTLFFGFCSNANATAISEIPKSPFEYLNSAKNRIVKFMPNARLLEIWSSDYKDAFGVGKCNTKELNYRFQDDTLGASGIVAVHENWVGEQCQTELVVSVSDDRFDYPITGVAYLEDRHFNSLVLSYVDSITLAQKYASSVGDFQLLNYYFFMRLEPGPLKIYYKFLGYVCDQPAIIYVNAADGTVNKDYSQLPSCK